MYALHHVEKVHALAGDFRGSASKKPTYIHLCISADYGVLFRGVMLEQLVDIQPLIQYYNNQKGITVKQTVRLSYWLQRKQPNLATGGCFLSFHDFFCPES